MIDFMILCDENMFDFTSQILLQIGKLYFCIEHIIIFLEETVLCGRHHVSDVSPLSPKF